MAGTHAPSTAVYDEVRVPGTITSADLMPDTRTQTHPTMFGIPPGRVPEGPRAPAFESQGQFPKPHFCEQAMAGTHEASIAVYDMVRAFASKSSADFTPDTYTDTGNKVRYTPWQSARPSSDQRNCNKQSGHCSAEALFGHAHQSLSDHCHQQQRRKTV